ncbi:hypothetical protein [Streptococcus parasanguinis]|uniref:hypothetical protein n=1 Tax=Streptococcus parasanguinis TaxID=1318 RepID=UPI00066B75B2|nr:hypothetical protein [Streptococcus parasanguinis]MBS6743327.1 hypothetical protein [Streptococcus parasanguinis]MDK8143147.1 hypothetical protein [Streptococcus parasanguinis]
MKKWTSLALLGLTSATLLVACGSKKEENSSSVKETQTSMKSGQKKTNQSSKKKNTKATESSSEETTQSSQTTTASNTTSSDKATDSSQMVPAELVGTWTGTTEIAKDVQMTVAADGTVTTTANFYQADVNPIRTATTRAKAVQASGNIYYWETDEPGAFDALLPGIAGLGGANAKVKAGFILEEGHYTPIVFVTGLNEEFDYSKYNDFRVSLTK